MPQLGQVNLLGFDTEGYECRERLDALVDCPRCGKEVECWSDTEEWTQLADGRWSHIGYGGSVGTCEACRVLIADCLSDGFQWFDMGENDGETRTASGSQDETRAAAEVADDGERLDPGD